jgi:SHS2 domain-containing protein
VIERRHHALPHTADAGIEASGPDVAAVLEEAALGLADLMAEADPGAAATVRESVDLTTDDLPALVYAWLNELIGLADLHRAAVVAVEADPVAVGPPWRLAARIGLRPFDAGGVRPGRGVKSATYHGLIVDGSGEGWVVRAYLDI